MKIKNRFKLFRIVNTVLIASCLVQFAMADGGGGGEEAICTTNHGVMCPAMPQGEGCTYTSYRDNPMNCCYINGFTCCSLERWKHTYVGTCPGLPANCSDCYNGLTVGTLAATCNTSTGYCDL